MTLTWILASIIVLPMGYTVPWTFLQCGTIWGVYIHETKKIYTCEWVDKFIDYHEIAHYYWYNKLSEKDRQKYTKEYNKAKTYFRAYSSTSVEEDFADAYGTITQSVYLETEINRELKKRQRLALKLISKYY